MEYLELKKFNLNFIETKTEAEEWKKIVLESDFNDTLKYLNFLRWQQYNIEDFEYTKKIIKFLMFSEIKEFLKTNPIINGEVEDLNLSIQEKVYTNLINIDNKQYLVKAILEDDFENIMIVDSISKDENLEEPLNEELASEYIESLKQLLIPMTMEELNTLWTNDNIKDCIEIVNGLLSEESDFNLNKALVEITINKIREDNTKVPFKRSDVNSIQKFGFITTPKNLAYELFEESQEYYNQIIDAKPGTKVNIYCDIVGEHQVSKTFKKLEKLIKNVNFELIKKTSLGIISNTVSGSFNVIKKENVLSNNTTKKEKKEIEKEGNINVMGLGKMNQETFLKTIKAACKSNERTKEKEYVKDDFMDNFKFSEKKYFSIFTPDQDYECDVLTNTILVFHGNEEDLELGEDILKYFVSDKYDNEVYSLLKKVFNIYDEEEGTWIIPNTKLEKVVRKLISVNSEIDIVEDGAGLFLKRFLNDKNFKKNLEPVMNLQIVKTLKTKKDVESFAKDSGTELYVQLGQMTVAVCEGVQRLFGKNHIMFDSDYKMIVCQYDNLDLYEASCYAIDNEYKSFYVIEDDKYQHYDAYCKETLVHIDNEAIVGETQQEENNLNKIENIITLNDQTIYQDGNVTVNMGIFQIQKEKKYNTIIDDIDGVFEEDYLFESETKTDIIISGTCLGDSQNAEVFITDDYTEFSISINGKKIISDIESDGFITINTVTDFIELNQNIEDGGLCFDEQPCGHYLIKNFTGKIKLNVKDEDGNNIASNKYDRFDYINHQLDSYCDISIDLDSKITPILLTDKLYDDLVNNLGSDFKLIECGEKITTEICVKHICEYFKNLDGEQNSSNFVKKQWKRISKSGSTDIKRKFQNKISGDIVYVLSIDTIITNIIKEN